MEQVQNEKIVDLIRKCLNLSKSPNENEAAAALSKAQELLEKYNLEMADIRERLEPALFDLVDLPLTPEKKLQNWKLYLIHYVALTSMCKVITSGKTLHILGRGINVSATMEMSLWIINQLEELAWWHTQTYQGPDSKLSYRTSFTWGAVNRIHQRLKESQETRMETNPNTKALVLGTRGELVKFTRERFPNLTSSSSYHSTNSSQGYHDGVRAGNEVSLSGANRQVYPGALPQGGS